MAFFSLRRFFLPSSFLVKGKNRRKMAKPKLNLEKLEDLTLPATLDLVGGELIFTGTGSTANVITISFPTDTISVQNTQETITLSAGALSAGWSYTSAIKVTGPSSSVSSFNIKGGSSNSDALTVTDSGDTNPHSYLLNSGTLQRDSIPYAFSAIATLSVTGGNGVNTFTVNAIGNNTTKLTGGTSNDVFNVGNASNTLNSITAGKLTIAGGSNNTTTKITAAAGTQVAAQVVVGDTLTFFDQGETGNNSYTLAGNLLRNNANIASFSGIESLLLNTGIGNDTISVITATGITNLTVEGNSQSNTSDEIRIQQTNAGSITQINGGVGNDKFTIGNVTNTLNNIQGAISVKGGGHTAATTTAAQGTQVETTVTIGDSLTILDFGFNGTVSYGIGAKLVSTSGVGGMAYNEIETLSLSTSTGNATVNLGTKILPTGNGTGANPLGGAPTATRVIVNGLSTATTRTTVNVASTLAGGIVEVNGGLGNDIVNLGNDPTNSTVKTLGNLAGAVSFDGGGHADTTATAAAGTQVATTVLVGDTINLLDQTSTGDFSYGIGKALLTRTGAAPFAYKNTETLSLSTTTGNSTVELGAKTLPTSTPAPVNLNGGASAADRVTITGNSSSSTSTRVNVYRTGAATVESAFATEITLGAGNDQVVFGNESNSLDELASVVSLSGGANLSTTQVISPGTAAEATVITGDLIQLNDQGDTNGQKYGFGAALITRSGVAGIAYTKFESIQLSSSTGDDTIQIGPATLPPATPEPVNLNGGAPLVNALIFQGNGTGGVGDRFELTATESYTATQLTGSSENDVFTIVSSPGLGVSVQGAAHASGPCDTLEFDAAGGSVTYSPGAIQGGTNQVVAYSQVETFEAPTNTNGLSHVVGSTGNDQFEVINITGEVVFLTNSLVFPLAANTTKLSFEGKGGTDKFEVDYGGGAIPFDISVNASGGTNSVLALFGDGSKTTGSYLPDTTTPGAGVITVNDTQKVQFTGLEPLDATGFSRFAMLLPNANSVVSIKAGLDFLSKSKQALIVSGTSGGVAFETLAAYGNTTLVIDSSFKQGDDAITIESADNANGNTNFEVTAGTGLDTVKVVGPLLVAGNLALQSGTSLQLTGASIQTGGSQKYTGSIESGTGNTVWTSTTNQGIVLEGNVSPGGAANLGTIDLQTNKSVALGANKLIIDLDGTTGNDAISNTGSFDLTGATLDVNVISSKSGIDYTIVQSKSGSITGNFVGLPDGATFVSGGKTFKIQYSSTAVTLSESGGPQITSADKTTFKAGAFGTFTVTATGTPTPSLSETGALPSGITFVDNGDGTATLSGTAPSGTEGTYSFTITAANGQIPDATQKFTLTIGQAPAFTSADTTSFTVGAAGTFTVSTTGFPVAAINQAGTLPGGISFVDNGNGTATLSGTPDANTGGLYPITLTAANGVPPDATQNFTLVINQAPAITSANNTIFQTGVAGSFSFTATGYPATFSYSTSGTLPSGVTLNTDGTLSGTPDAGTGGIYNFTVTASNGVAPDATQDFTLTVNQAPAFTSVDTTTFTVGAAGTFTVSTTGFPIAALNQSGTLPGGISFVDNGNGTATLSGTPDANTGGLYPITLTAANGVAPDATQNFTLVINQAPAITSPNNTIFQTGVAGSFSFTATGYPATFSYSTSGSLPAGVTLNTDGTLSGTPDAGTGGIYNFTVTASNGVAPDATQDFTLTVNQAPAFTSVDTTTFTVGAAGTFTVSTTGFPIAALNQSGTLPVGISFTDNGNGTATLSGTPDANTGGLYPITLTAANGVAPDATQNFTLVINQAPAITSPNNTTFQTGVAGSFSFTATGYPATFSYSTSGTLPSGVTLNTDGTLSGTPDAGTGGIYNFTVTASNGVAPDATQDFTLTVNQPPVIISPNTTNFTAGVTGSFQFESSGFPSAFTYSYTGTLPTGVTLDANGLLSGKPLATASGDFHIDVTSSNGVIPDGLQSFVLHVNPAGGVYYYDQAARTLLIQLGDDSHLVQTESGEVVSFSVSKAGSTVVLAAGPGSDVLPGDGTSTLFVDAAAINQSLTINNALATKPGSENSFLFSSGKFSTGSFGIDLDGSQGTGKVAFGADSNLVLSGELKIASNALVSLGGGLTAQTASFSFTDTAYALAIIGSTTQLTNLNLGNGGALTLGDEATDSLTVSNGLDASGLPATATAGTILTNSQPIAIKALTLLANTVLDTRGTGAGSKITISNGLVQNGFTLTTFAAPDQATTVTGDLKITDPITAVTGGITFGDGTTPTTLTFDADAQINSPTGAIGFGDKTEVVTGSQKVLFVSDAINIDPGTKFTGTGTLGFSPSTPGYNTYLGDAAGTPLPGLKFPQNTLDQFSETFENIQFGMEGYDGLITVGNTKSTNPLTLITNGGGGKVLVTGDLEISGSDADGIGLRIIGSGHTTVIAADIITAGADIIIDDAIQLDASVILDTTNGGVVPTGADVILTGGTAGIYATKGATNNLNIDGGTKGGVTLGAFHGFGDNSTQASLVNHLTINADQIRFPTQSNRLGGNLTLNLTPAGTATLDKDLTTGGGLFLNGGTTFQLDGFLNATGPIIQTGATATVRVGANLQALGGLTVDGALVQSNAIVIAAQGIHLNSIQGSGFDLTLKGNPAGVHSVIQIDGTVGGVNRLSVLGGESVDFAKTVSVNQITFSEMKAATKISIADNLSASSGLTTQAGTYDLSLLGASNTIGPVSLFHAGGLVLGDESTDQTRFTSSAALTSPGLAVTIQGTVISQGDLTLNAWKAGDASKAINLVGNNIYLFGGKSEGGLDAKAMGSLEILGLITSGNTTLKTGGALALNEFLTVTGDLVFSGGSVAQGANGSLMVSGNSALAATGDILLDGQNLLGGEIQFTGNNVTIATVGTQTHKVWTGAVPPAFRSSATGNLTLSTLNGNITALSPLAAGGITKLICPGNDLIATGPNDWIGPLSFEARNVNLTNIQVLVLGSSIATGNVSLNTSFNNRNITQTGPLVAPNGSITINAGTGSIVLDNPLNNFAAGGALSLTASNARIGVTGTLLLGTSTIGNDLDLIALGGVNQSNGITVGNRLRVQSQGTINLPSFNNSFPILSITEGVGATVITTGAIVLDGINLDSAFTLLPGGHVTQTGSVKVVGAGAQTIINAGAFNVTLPDLLNDSVSLTVTANRTEIADANHLTLLNGTMGELVLNTGLTAHLNSITVNGPATIASGLDIRGGNNSFAQDVHFQANQNITLVTDANTFGGTVDFVGTDVNLQATGDLKILFGKAAGALTLGSGGSITQSSQFGFSLAAGGPANLSAVKDILLTVASNIFQGPVSLNGQTIQLANATNTTLGTTVATGDLTVQAKGFGISQSGNVSVTGKAGFDAGSGDIHLGGNNTIGQVSLTGGKIDFATTTPVTVNALNTTSDVSLSAPAGFTFPNEVSGVNRLTIANMNANSAFSGGVSANQLLVQAGSGGATLTIGGDANLPGGLTTAAGSYNLTLNGAKNTIGPVSLLHQGALNLGNGTNDETLFTGSAALAAPSLTVNIQGSVISQGDLTLFGWKGADAANPISLTANNIYLFSGASSGGLNLNAPGDVNIQGVINAGSTTISTNGALFLNSALNVTGDLVVDGGSITQTDDGGLTVTGRSALVTSGDIFLDSVDLMGAVQFQGRNVEINNDEALDLRVWNPNVPPANLNSAFGNLVLFVLDGDIVGTSPLSVGGTSSLTALVGDIELGNKSSLAGPVKLFGVNVTIENTVDLKIASAIVKGNLDLKLSSLAESLTQTGPIQVQDGTTTIDAGTGVVILENSLNDFGNQGALNISANQATISDANKVNLGSIKVTGAFNLTAGGDITQSGIIQTGLADFTSTGDIVLENAANTFGPLSATGNTIKATSSGALVVSEILAMDNLTLSTGGHLTQTGPIIANSEGATTTINAPGFNVTLDDSRNDFNQMTIAAGVNVILTEANDFLVNNSQIQGNLFIASIGSTGLFSNTIGGFVDIQTGEDIFGGSNTISNDSLFNATGSIFLDNFNNTFVGGMEFNGKVVSVKASGDLKLFEGSASITLSLVSTGSIIQEASQGSFSLSGNAILQAANDIRFKNDQNVFLGNISASGNNIEIHNAENLNLSGITAKNNLVLKGIGISQSGPISVNGTADLDGGGGDILLIGDNKIGVLDSRGNNISVRAVGDLYIDGTTATGNLNFTSSGSIVAFGDPITVGGTTSFNAAVTVDVISPNSVYSRSVRGVAQNGSFTLKSTGNLFIESVSAATKANLFTTGNLLIQGPVTAEWVELNASGKSSQISGSITAENLFWNGPGIVSISGLQSVTSRFQVAEGIARIMGNEIFNSDATLDVLADGVFFLGGYTQTFNGLDGEGTIGLGSLANRGSLILENSVDALFRGVISGDGDLLKVGVAKQTLLGEQTFTGQTRILEGTLQLGDITKNGSVDGPILLGDGVLLFRPATALTVDQPIQDLDPNATDKGRIILDSPTNAILSISGKNAFTGETLVQRGTLNLTTNLATVTVNDAAAKLTGTGTIQGDLTAIQGTIAPGNATLVGTLTVTGEAVLGAQSTLLIGLASNTNFGVLQAGATTLQNGNLVVQVASGYTPPNLQNYTILKANPTVTGQFAQKTVVFSDPYFFQVNYLSNQVVLQKVPGGVVPGTEPLVVAPAMGSSIAVIYDTNNQVRARLQPMGSWLGGMRVAQGDVNGDGWSDYIFGAAAGGGPRVVVIDGVTLKQTASFFAYAPGFTGGVYLAAGDIDGNDQVEIITGAGAGAGSHVRAFTGSGVATSTSFMAYLPPYNGGVTVAAGDLNGDGTEEIITGAASNGGSHVAAWNAQGQATGLSFFAYNPQFLAGITVAAADLNGDGLAEIITGPNAGGGPNLKVFSPTGQLVASNFAFLPTFTGGLTVGSIKTTPNGPSQVVTAPQSGGFTYPGPRVYGYDLDLNTLVLVTNILVYDASFQGGMWVA